MPEVKADSSRGVVKRADQRADHLRVVAGELAARVDRRQVLAGHTHTQLRGALDQAPQRRPFRREPGAHGIGPELQWDARGVVDDEVADLEQIDARFSVGAHEAAAPVA